MLLYTLSIQIVPVNLTAFDSHAVRKIFTKHSNCGVLSDKGLFVFGYNKFSALGLGITEYEEIRKPTKVERLKGIEIIDFELGYEHGIALSKTGEVYSWGRGDCGRLGTTIDETETTPKVIWVHTKTLTSFE